MSLAARTLAYLITGFARVVTGAQARWLGCSPAFEQRIYFGNHASHADFLLIYAALPPALQAHTRPVAGADYWEVNALRRYVIHAALHGVLVERAAGGTGHPADAVATMAAALDAGDSLILFPEGTRNTGDAPLLPFKSGLFHLAGCRPDVPLVPVWLENLGRVLPKGASIPVPLLCTVNFGTPLLLQPGETKAAFLERTREALLAVAAQVQPR